MKHPDNEITHLLLTMILLHLTEYTVFVVLMVIQIALIGIHYYTEYLEAKIKRLKS